MAKKKYSYPIRTTEDVFASNNSTLIDVLREIGRDKTRLILVVDSNVAKRTQNLGTKIGRYLQTYGLSLATRPIIVEGGERIKVEGLQWVERVIGAMLESRVGRSNTVLAIGGGSVLDIAGFACAQVRGGIGLIRLPTTVGAMINAAFVDTAIVDAAEVKDALRLPSMPLAVIVDTTFARTILDGVWRGGLSEAVRLALVSDAALYRRIRSSCEKLRTRDYATFVETIRDCVAVREKKGMTPFAEWIAMRLKAMTGSKLPHGYAIAIAICIECAYAVERGLMTAEDAQDVRSLLEAFGSMDGLARSIKHVGEAESLLRGLNALELFTGSRAVTLPTAIGKSVIEETPDREAYMKVLTGFRCNAGDSTPDENQEANMV